MQQIAKGFLSVLLVLLIAGLGFIVYANFNHNRDVIKENERLGETPRPVITDGLPTEPVPETTPSSDGENVTEMTLGVYGDVVVHSGLNADAKQEDGSYDYVPIFGDIVDSVTAADYAICTIETALMDTEPTGYPMFKSPDGLAVSLKNVGFDLINTASNHCLDGLEGGLYRTLDVLDANGLDHVGTYRSQEERDANSGIVSKEINGITFAFLSYTYSTNAIPVTGFEYAVNLIFNDHTTTQTDIDYDSMRRDMAAARALNADFIVPIMHWGNEYEREPVAYQIEIADFLFKEGADIILGGHVHVPEPMELRHVVDNEGNEKIGFIAYCLGNLISCQNDRYTDLTAGLDITLVKDHDTGKAVIKHISYKPLLMVDLDEYGITADWRYRLWDTRAAINSYDNGDNLGVINDRLYADLKLGIEDLHSIFDPAFDEANGGVDVATWVAPN